MSLWARWQRWREQRQLQRFAIPDALWHALLANYPFVARRSAADLAELRRLCSLFLARKRFHTSGGLQLTDAMALAVAAQACLPVLRLDLALYDGTVGIVLHPGEVLAPREEVDEHGVVHQWDEVLAGEAMPGGPLMLSWEAVQQADDPEQPVFNVVVHEFVHLLDLRHGGDANGLPEITDPVLRQRWLAELPLAWDRFADRVAHRESSCIDPYGSAALDEFFAVAAEAFFVAPQELRAEDPPLYALLAAYFRQDPADA
ncbi:M90 family metallopeptidase [Inhella proteolytica]|uniref:Zinc-dependent peptidase n=1 Tax=Inhella proteolytica TaxID=2795029 RepID=A0A931J2W4_9BURK|nr:M90 family metallopeptidase [Inhella proteolytica]MBH9578574.1 zinc-dependent peptidase [Inhella proteolytica]